VNEQDKSVVRSVSLTGEIRPGEAYALCRIIRELEAEVNLATAQSVDRFNRWHDAEVEAAALRAEAVRLLRERDAAREQAQTNIREAERREHDNIDSYAAGYHEALDLVAEAVGTGCMTYYTEGDKPRWSHEINLRTRYPREQEWLVDRRVRDEPSKEGGA
jgi:hypothetical protein